MVGCNQKKQLTIRLGRQSVFEGPSLRAMTAPDHGIGVVDWRYKVCLDRGDSNLPASAGAVLKRAQRVSFL